MPRFPQRIPSFLHGKTVTKGEAKELDKLTGNWLEIHNFITELKPTVKSIRIMEKLMLHEYNRPTGARMDIIVRLYGKYSKLRYEIERVELGITR